MTVADNNQFQGESEVAFSLKTPSPILFPECPLTPFSEATKSGRKGKPGMIELVLSSTRLQHLQREGRLYLEPHDLDNQLQGITMATYVAVEAISKACRRCLSAGFGGGCRAEENQKFREVKKFGLCGRQAEYTR